MRPTTRSSCGWRCSPQSCAGNSRQALDGRGEALGPLQCSMSAVAWNDPFYLDVVKKWRSGRGHRVPGRRRRTHGCRQMEKKRSKARDSWLKNTRCKSSDS